MAAWQVASADGGMALHCTGGTGKPDPSGYCQKQSFPFGLFPCGPCPTLKQEPFSRVLVHCTWFHDNKMILLSSRLKRATLQRAQHAGAEVLGALPRRVGAAQDGGGLGLRRPLRRPPEAQRQDQALRHPRQLPEGGIQVRVH